MFDQYLKETLNLDMIKDPEGRGFLTYGFDCVPGADFRHVYIQDLYVLPEHRKSHIAAKMADEVGQIAKAKGYGVMFGTVSKHSKTPDRSREVLTRYGMDLYAEDKDTYWYAKELK